MRAEHARLGVETTMRSDRIARSATEFRSSWLIDQRHSARPERKALEKTQQGGPTMGSSSPGARLRFVLDQFKGGNVRRFRNAGHKTPCRVDREARPPAR